MVNYKQLHRLSLRKSFPLLFRTLNLPLLDMFLRLPLVGLGPSEEHILEVLLHLLSYLEFLMPFPKQIAQPEISAVEPKCS